MVVDSGIKFAETEARGMRVTWGLFREGQVLGSQTNEKVASKQ